MNKIPGLLSAILRTKSSLQGAIHPPVSFSKQLTLPFHQLRLNKTHRTPYTTNLQGQAIACNLLHRSEIKESKILKSQHPSIFIYHYELGPIQSFIINIAFCTMQVIKGPELLNMSHGNTKVNVRNLFSEAISKYKKYGKDYKFERDLLYILLEHVLTVLYFPPF